MFAFTNDLFDLYPLSYSSPIPLLSRTHSLLLTTAIILHLAQVSSFLAIEATAVREVELMNETR